MNNWAQNFQKKRRLFFILYLLWVMVFMVRNYELFRGGPGSNIHDVRRLIHARHLNGVIAVPITEEDFTNLFGRLSPLDPEKVIEIIKIIHSAKPAVLVVDLDTSDAKYQSLAETIPGNPPIPIVWARRAICRSIENAEGACHEDESIGFDKVVGRAQDPLPPSFAGIADLPNNGGIRTFKRAFLGTDGTVADSIAFSALRQFCSLKANSVITVCRDPCLSKPQDCLAPVVIDYSLSKPRSISAGSLVSLAHGSGQNSDFKELLRDKIVFLGGQFTDSRDFYETPAGVKYAMDIHLEAFAAELSNDVVQVRWRCAVAAELASLLILYGAVLKTGQYKYKLAARFSIVILGMMLLALTLSWVAFQRLALFLTFVPLLAVSLLDLFADIIGHQLDAHKHR